MQGLEALKETLKKLVGEDKPSEAFRLLREEVLRTNSELYNELITVQASYYHTQREGKLNLIEYKDKNISFSNVSQALLWIIDRVEASDLGQHYRARMDAHQPLPPYVAYTIDRMEQTDQLQLNYHDTPGPDAKLRFFYLYGDARQAHEQLVARASLDFGGQLLGWREQAPASRPKMLTCKPSVSGNPKLFYINLVREVLNRMGCRESSLQPVASQKLSSALASDELRHLGKDDLVFVLLTIDDYNWRPDLTPRVVREFIQQFCTCELPEHAPRFFFFFGLEYKKDNVKVREEVQEEVRQAVAQSDLPIEALPELLPINHEHLAEWFSRYRELMTEGLDYDTMAARAFPGAVDIDMADAVRKAKEIIDLHNRGFIHKI